VKNNIHDKNSLLFAPERAAIPASDTSYHSTCKKKKKVFEKFLKKLKKGVKEF